MWRGLQKFPKLQAIFHVSLCWLISRSILSLLILKQDLDRPFLSRIAVIIENNTASNAFDYPFNKTQILNVFLSKQFINIVVNLLEALKTSFSHRSMAARHLGKKDSVSDAAVAGISMMKGYVRALTTGEGKCMEKYLCEASSECAADIGQGSMFCNLGRWVLKSYINVNRID